MAVKHLEQSAMMSEAANRMGLTENHEQRHEDAAGQDTIGSDVEESASRFGPADVDVKKLWIRCSVSCGEYRSVC